MPQCYSIQIGPRHWKNITFETIVSLMAHHVNSEYEAYKWHVSLNEEMSTRATISEHLGGAVLPSPFDFSKPLNTINGARSYVQRGGREEIAFKSLELAALEYNAVHKAWSRYRNQVQGGGEAAILLMVVTMAIATAVPAASAGGLVTATKLAMGLKATEEVASSIGERYILDDKITSKKLLSSATKVVLSGLFAKLGDMFVKKMAAPAASKMVERSSTWLMGEKEVADALAMTAAKADVKKSFLGFVAKFIESSASEIPVNAVKGAINKSPDASPATLTSRQFWESVCDEMAHSFWKGEGKAALKAWAKTTLAHFR